MTKIARALKNKMFGTPEVEQVLSGKELIQQKGDNIKGVFMHIHKCAGTSLIDQFDKCGEIISCVARPGNFPKRTGKNYIPESIWKNSLKFSFVRNPYSRILSAYYMFTTSPKWKSVFPEYDDFTEYLKWADVQNHFVEGEKTVEEYHGTLDNILHHCSSFTNPKYCLNELDYVGKVETLSGDLENIASQLNITLGKPNKLNSAKKKYDYREVYTSYSKAIITDLYRQDIEKFEYEF